MASNGEDYGGGVWSGADVKSCHGGPRWSGVVVHGGRSIVMTGYGGGLGLGQLL